MSKVFLQATTTDGAKHVSEFSKLGKISRYVRGTFGQHQPFNVWKIVATAHPESGEPTLIRTRTFLNPALIVDITQVERKPDADPTSYAPADFLAVRDMQHGTLGLWTAPTENTPEGVTPGARYPLHQDLDSLDRFIYLHWSEDEAECVKYVVNPSAAFVDARDEDDEA